MTAKMISLLFFLSFINAQIALPTFQGVHTPHTTSSGTPENPLQSSGIGTTSINIAWTWMMGYKFTPQVNGEITHLGGRFNGTKTVRLWSVSSSSSGSFLGSVSVDANNNWSYAELASSISVTAGTTYIVAVALNGSGGQYRSAWAGPHTYGNVTINACVLEPNYNSDSYPTWDYFTYTWAMYGMADVTFVPDE